jgi:hypothetical protein
VVVFKLPSCGFQPNSEFRFGFAPELFGLVSLDSPPQFHYQRIGLIGCSFREDRPGAWQIASQPQCFCAFK